MKIVIDDIFYSDLKNYLLSQDGINDVEIKNEEFISEININFDEKITPMIILKHINLYQPNDFSTLLSFDKEQEKKCNILKHTVEDMCCEYCYKGLVEELFNNNFIKSVKSNFDFHKPAYNIEFLIEYYNDYSEEELIKFINDKIR